MYSQNTQGYPLTDNLYQNGHIGEQGMNFNNQGQVYNMQSLKPALPNVQGPMDHGKPSRTGQTNPFMVLPSGQTVPLSAIQSQNAINGNGFPYMQQGLMPTLIGNTAYGAGSMGQYTWPYAGLSPSNVDLDSRHVAWAANDENVTMNSVVGATVPTDFVGGLSTHPVALGGAQYRSGSYQTMKTTDNKGYEFVDLDALLQKQPPVPRAVPALWTNQEEMTLAKCLQNPEGITNVYIRGFMPDTTDEDLHHWANRFGEIESCKAIIDQDTGKCKGFGFVMYYSPASAENCIRGFFHHGFQASYAQKSRNSRLKDLEDRSSTNIYCTGVPIDWNESDLAKHFLPFNAVSTKICRDSPSGVSKEVGFARFESREVAERVIREFHSTLIEHDDVKLYLRFADTKAQKQLKQQSQERRQWRSREYSYSVEHTPSPITGRLQSMSHISPSGSYHSPAGVGANFTPATSVSPAEVVNANKVVTANSSQNNGWPTSGGLQSITNQSQQAVHTTAKLPTLQESSSAIVVKVPAGHELTKTPSPKRVTIKIEPASGKENVVTPPTVI